ncbi:MAG: PaaI family thioesterase [Myxococcales bacterium]|nr:PaaI family thioesterase [Myxococcales bacterium]
MTPEQRREITRQINERVHGSVPHNRALGLELLDFRYETGEAWMRLPYAEKLVGDPTTGVLHGAAITTLMDATCGMAVMIKLATREPIATVDLRIDYLKPARPKLDVVAHAECFKATRSIAFVRGFAHHPEAPDDPIASVAATFIRKGAA